MTNFEGGYVTLPRELWRHPMFRCELEAAAFAWMASMAQWRDTTLSTPHGPVELKAGELLFSERTLAERFALHRNTLRRLLDRLICEGWITLSRDHHRDRLGTICRIEIYKQFQGSVSTQPAHENDAGTSSETSAGPVQDQFGTKNKNVKKEKKIEEVQEASPLACASPPPEVDQPLFEAPKKSHQGDLLHTADVVHLSARDVDKVLARWNVMVKGLPAGAHIPAVRGAAGARERAVRKALREVGGLEGIDVLFGKVAASKFLNGQGGSFSATFDWVFAGGQRGGPNYQKIMEGNYDREFTQARKRGPDLSYMKRRFGAGLEPDPQPDAWQGTTIDMPLDGETEIV
jgi:hypothetical protein